MTLSSTLAEKKTGKAKLDDVASSFYRDLRVKRLIHHACNQWKLPHQQIEEVTQELAVLLTQKFTDSTTDPEKIYNVLHVSACHIARRKAGKTVEDSLDAILEISGNPDRSTFGIMHDRSIDIENVEFNIDRVKAKEEFNRRVKTVEPEVKGQFMKYSTVLRMSYINTTPQIVKRVDRKPKSQESNVHNTPSKEGVELNEIRNRLGHTVPDFARLLNTSKGTLASYLYGIVQNVPEKILNEARVLCAQSEKHFEGLHHKFGNRSMTEIVDIWISDLGIEDGKKKDTLLAQILDVDRATVWRWRERNMRPELRKLKEYDDKVKLVCGKT